MIITPIEPGVTYRNTIFRDAKLPNGLEGASFLGCTFEAVRWREIALCGCRFVACAFVDSDLSLVDLDGSALTDVTFDACGLTGVNWARATDTASDPFGIDLRGCVLNFGSFQGCNLSRRRIDLCVAHECDFRDADLRDAVCRGTDFKGSDLHGADLRGADFRRARNYSIDIRHTKVAGAAFSAPEVMALLEGLDVEVEVEEPEVLNPT